MLSNFVDRFSDTSSIRVNNEIRSHEFAYKQISWLLGVFQLYLNSSTVDQLSIDQFLDNECYDNGLGANRATSTAGKIIKLALRCDRKVVSNYVRIIDILIANNVTEDTCIEWIKNAGGMRLLCRRYDRDGKIRPNNKMDLLELFVKQKFNANMTASDLTEWLHTHSKELASILVR